MELIFQPWNELLNRYVDSQGRVNYSAWKRESEQSLKLWLQELRDRRLNVELDLNRDQQLALWLNLYNALTIAQVLEFYPLRSIRPTILGIPNWFAFLQFFSRPLYSFNGQSYSLNDIEHGTLRPVFQEPRIHFALVCASIGCPLLRGQAYVAESVRVQLEEDARRFINNPDKVRYDDRRQTLYCSKIFKWYRRDFLTVAASIPHYLQAYLSYSLPVNEPISIQYLPYDWNLNQRISS